MDKFVISANSIAKYMKSQGQSITSTTIIEYVKYLAEAYILHKVNRYDIRGKMPIPARTNTPVGMSSRRTGDSPSTLPWPGAVRPW